MDQNKPTFSHVVIIGAGFGGLAAAKELSNQAVRVTLVDEKNYHLFQPLLYQVATAELNASEIAVPIRHVFKKAHNIEVMLATVNGIDAEKKIVSTDNGFTIAYDYLILATGARKSYFGHDDWEGFAPGLKTIEDAHSIKNRILSAFEKAESETDLQRQQAYLTFIIVGGGPTGVEMAGAVAEIARKALFHEFRNISPELSRIILVDAGPHILHGFDKSLADQALDDLDNLGVQVLTHSRIESIGSDFVVLEGNKIDTATVIWAAGVQASPAAQWLGIEVDHDQRIPVDENMTVNGFKDIYAIGDLARYVPAGLDKPLPGIAPVAKQQGHFIGKFILATIEGRSVPSFVYRNRGSMATIGRNKAVVWIYGWRFTGFIGWLLWSLVHIYYLVGFPNRFQVAFSWLWNYVTSQRSVRLIIGDNKQIP